MYSLYVRDMVKFHVGLMDQRIVIKLFLHSLHTHVYLLQELDTMIEKHINKEKYLYL